MCVVFCGVQERDQRRWDDSHFRCKEDKSPTAALQGHDGISGIGRTEINQSEERKAALMVCDDVAGADWPGSKQRRAAGGQGEQPAAGEMPRNLGQPFHSFYPLSATDFKAICFFG